MAFGDRKILTLAALAGAAVAAAGLIFAPGAFAQSNECARLQAAIASAPRGGNGQMQAAAARQRAELARTSAYAASMGCNNQKFLIFGSDPPPQCGQVRGQIARMQANLDDLEARGGGGGGGQRDALIARFNAECANAPRQPGNIFEALFGGGRPQQQTYEPVDPNSLSPDEQQQMLEQSIDKEKKGANVSAGSYAVCVKTCDGSFFPVSYSGAGSRADSLEDVCRSLCPAADVALYSFPFGGTIDQAVSTSGERYVDLPNSLKYQQTFDSSCSCRRKGESWAQALAAAEAKYGHGAKDILVTPAKSAEMARPIVSKANVDAKAAKSGKPPQPQPPQPDATAAAGATGASAAPGQNLDASGTDTALSAAAASVSRETSGIGAGDAQSGANYGQGQGQTITESGPDGVKRKVRIVGPTL